MIRTLFVKNRSECKKSKILTTRLGKKNINKLRMDNTHKIIR